jgi:hypothetical protein
MVLKNTVHKQGLELENKGNTLEYIHPISIEYSRDEGQKGSWAVLLDETLSL